MEFDFGAAAAAFNREQFIQDVFKLGVTNESDLSLCVVPGHLHIVTDVEPDDVAAMSVLTKVGAEIESIILIERKDEDGWDRAGRLDAFVAQNKQAYGSATIRKNTALDARTSIVEIVEAHAASEFADENLTFVWLANVLPVYDFLCQIKESPIGRANIDFFIYGSVNLRWAVKMLAKRDGISVEEARARLMAALHQNVDSSCEVNLFESYPMFCDVASNEVLSINDIDTPDVIDQLKKNGQTSDSAFLLKQMEDWNKEMLTWQLQSVAVKHGELAHVNVDNVHDNLDLLDRVGNDKATAEGLARSIRLCHRIAKTPNQMVFADVALAIAIVSGFAFTPVVASFTDAGFVQVSKIALSESTTEPHLWYSVRASAMTGREMFADFVGHYWSHLKSEEQPVAVRKGCFA